ncbi:MAG: RrF2 family transcriptional regulator [Planctomycetota bacterium]
MTTLSRKCQYALRCLLELARHHGNAPVSVAHIADAQAIPRRFLELIVRELRLAGIVTAHRGARGGYTLTRDPGEISVGGIIRLIDGEQTPVRCKPCGGDESCALADDCSFAGLWRRIHAAVAGICDETTFADLLDEHKRPA